MHFVKNLGLTDKQIDGVFSRFEAKLKDAQELLFHSFLPLEYQEKYLKTLQIRSQVLLA